MTDLTLTTAFTKIQGLDPDLSEALQALHAQLVDVNPAPSFKIREYKYGDKIFDRGKPTDVAHMPDAQTRVGDEYGLPLGVILDGQSEVLDLAFTSSAVQSMPQAILGPGDFIGLFEFIDQRVMGAVPSRPDWTITAGLVTVLPPFHTHTRAFSNHLNSLNFRGSLERSSFEGSAFVDRMLNIPAVAHNLRRRKVLVLYIGPDWFDRASHDEDDGLRAARQRLMHVLMERAWRAAARIRPVTTNISQYFLPESTKNHSLPVLNEAMRNVSAFAHLYDCFTGRRPVLVPEDRDSIWGEFGYLCREVLKGYNNDEAPVLLRPAYLHRDHCPVGYMPTDALVSSLKSGKSTQDAIFDTLDAIASAADNERRSQGGSILRITGVSRRVSR